MLIVLKLTVFRFNTHYRTFHPIPLVTLLEIYRYFGIGRVLFLFFGNIFMFAPFGFLTPVLMKKKSLLKIVALGFLFSLFIETCQFVFYKGEAEADDLICNTAGAAIGYAVYKITKKFFRNSC